MTNECASPLHVCMTARITACNSDEETLKNVEMQEQQSIPFAARHGLPAAVQHACVGRAVLVQTAYV